MRSRTWHPGPAQRVGGAESLSRGGPQRRDWLGKRYYRPPGGESWADEALGLQSVFAELNILDTGHSVMPVCRAVIMPFRYVLVGLTEGELLDLVASETGGRTTGSGGVRARFGSGTASVSFPAPAPRAVAPSSKAAPGVARAPPTTWTTASTSRRTSKQTGRDLRHVRSGRETGSRLLG